MAILVTSNTELDKRLRFETAGPSVSLCSVASTRPSLLPGQPRVSLNDGRGLSMYLEKEYLVPDLDRLVPKLWLVSTPRASHISALHHQAARGRDIVVAENPQLHLVWSYNRIFIKPIPPYLLSHAFWQYIQTNEAVYRAAAGFLRSYSYLIRYEVDFRRATAEPLCLIPTHDGQEEITFERFAKFVAPFAELEDCEVAPRYQYGELRLTRLNICARIFLGRLTFYHIDAQWGSYIGRYLGPMLSVFAVFSVILSAMQVELAVQSILPESDGWVAFSNACRLFSVLTVSLAAIGIFSIGSLTVFMFLHDIWFARTVLCQERSKEKGEILPDFKSGVV